MSKHPGTDHEAQPAAPAAASPSGRYRRRALILGAAAAGAGAAVSVVGAAIPAGAAPDKNGSPVLLGDSKLRPKPRPSRTPQAVPLVAIRRPTAGTAGCTATTPAPTAATESRGFHERIRRGRELH